jgi:hypothetical protein
VDVETSNAWNAAEVPPERTSNKSILAAAMVFAQGFRKSLAVG